MYTYIYIYIVYSYWGLYIINQPSHHWGAPLCEKHGAVGWFPPQALSKIIFGSLQVIWFRLDYVAPLQNFRVQ